MVTVNRMREIEKEKSECASNHVQAFYFTRCIGITLTRNNFPPNNQTRIISDHNLRRKQKKQQKN